MSSGKFQPYSDDGGVAKPEAQLVDETICLNQQRTAGLYQQAVRAINVYTRTGLEEGDRREGKR